MAFNDLIVLDSVYPNGTAAECPMNYMPLFDQMWFGLEEGCNCTGIFNKKVRKPNGLVQGSCRILEQAEGCTDTEKEEQKRLTSYKGKLLCKEPLPQQLTFFNMHPPDKNNHSCPEGKKICGSD
jgi:hypothetical protein